MEIAIVTAIASVQTAVVTATVLAIPLQSQYLGKTRNNKLRNESSSKAVSSKAVNERSSIANSNSN
jgi:hypothetical protein